MISGVKLSDVSIQKLAQRNMGEDEINAFSNILSEAQSNQRSALDFVGSLSKLDLEILQNAHSLADPINVSFLSEEGASNLLTQPDNQKRVDLNNDGIVEVGIARNIHFPPVNAPQFVKDAWDKATEGMSEFDKAFLQLSMHHSIYSTGINTYSDQRSLKQKSLSPSQQWSAAGIEKLMDARYSNLQFRVNHDGWTEQNKMLKQFYERFENALSKGLHSSGFTTTLDKSSPDALLQTAQAQQQIQVKDKQSNEKGEGSFRSKSLNDLLTFAGSGVDRQKLEKINTRIETVQNSYSLSKKERQDKLLVLYADKERIIEEAQERVTEDEKRKSTLTKSQRLSENLKEREIKNSISNYQTSLPAVERTISSEKLIDPNSISLNEVNSLIKNGATQLLNVVPLISPTTISKLGTVAARDMKLDLLSQVETMIEFKRSIGENTSNLEEVERTLSRLQNIPPANRNS